jgi:hypothetical protein
MANPVLLPQTECSQNRYTLTYWSSIGLLTLSDAISQMRLRTYTTNRKLAPHMGSSTACWTAHVQGVGFYDIGSRHANIIDVAGRLVWSLLHTMDGRHQPKIERDVLRFCFLTACCFAAKKQQCEQF